MTAGVGLEELTQADWSGGICQAVARHLIPGDAAWDIEDGLLDDDGNVYQRGPTAHVSSNQLGAGLLALWEANFTVGRRLIGTSTKLGVMNAAGNAWIELTSTTGGLAGGGLAAQLGDFLFIPTSNGIYLYSGSLKTASYSTGTASATNGSAIVTGAGTAWSANVDAGMLFQIPGQAPLGVVKSVDSNTQVTLTLPWAGTTVAGSAYNLGRYGIDPLLGFSTAGSRVAAVGGRLLVSDGRKVKLSNTLDPETGQSRPTIFDVNDYHEFPADVVALATLRDVVYVMTKAGIYSISGAALPIVDAFGNPNHRVQQVSGDVVVRSPGGVTPWRDALVICAVGGIYVMEAGGALELVSRSIAPLWQQQMANNAAVGQAVCFRDHVFVPIASRVLVGRLDRRTKTPVGTSAPWTQFLGGEAALAAAFAVQDPFGAAKLVAGAPAQSAYLLDLTGVFGTGSLPLDVGGLRDANNAAVGMIVETREYVVDAGGLATVKDVALEYESSDGQVLVSASVGQRLTPDSAPTYTALAGSASGNYGSQNPRVIGVRREARRISYRLAANAGVTGWRLRAVRTRSRLRGRRR